MKITIVSLKILEIRFFLNLKTAILSLHTISPITASQILLAEPD